jgi:hypothetical protein
MSEPARDQVAVVIQALERDCEFNSDAEEYILEVSPYVVACEHVQGWGWTVFWYREEGSIIVQAEPSVRVVLKPKLR